MKTGCFSQLFIYFYLTEYSPERLASPKAQFMMSLFLTVIRYINLILDFYLHIRALHILSVRINLYELCSTGIFPLTFNSKSEFVIYKFIIYDTDLEFLKSYIFRFIHTRVYNSVWCFFL